LSIIQQIQIKCMKISWVFLVILLPVTSFPLIVRLVGSDVIGLPSGIFLLLMLVFWYLPSMWKGERIAKQHLLLFGFIIFALLSTALSAFITIPSYKGNKIVLEQVQSMLTLFIGAVMFMVTAKWTKDSGRLQQTYRLLNWSGLFVLLWSMAQALAWRIYGGYPAMMEVFHRFFSTGVLYGNRVTGLALEPSFFAHQLNCLYLPLWFSATIQNYSVYRKRVFGFSLENGLLILGVIALFLSLSRVGYLSFFMMLGVFFLQINHRFLDWTFGYVSKRMKIFRDEKTGSLKKRKQIRFWLRTGLMVLLMIGYLVLLASAIFTFVKIDPRMATFFEIDLSQDQWLFRYLGNMDLGPRISFWMAGWDVFAEHPLFGVGLGNSGFFFMDALPHYSWTFPEVRSLMWQSSSVLNPKNLWSRLLAETGVLGFSAFMIWLLGNWQTARELLQKKSPLLRQMGLMGIFVTAALLVEGFSVDSFALPYYWFSFGLVLSAYSQSHGVSKPLALKN